MKSKIFITILIVLIIAVNGLTVFWLVRDKNKAENIPEKSDAVVQPIFGQPTEITVVNDGKTTVLPQQEYKDVLSLLENSHKYVESFVGIDAFSDTDKLTVCLAYGKAHTFKYGEFEYDVTGIKINLYNAEGDMLLQTDDGDVALGYLNITAELVTAVK